MAILSPLITSCSEQTSGNAAHVSGEWYFHIDHEAGLINAEAQTHDIRLTGGDNFSVVADSRVWQLNFN